MGAGYLGERGGKMRSGLRSVGVTGMICVVGCGIRRMSGPGCVGRGELGSDPGLSDPGMSDLGLSDLGLGAS
jgi:hypothetical protein